LSNTEWRVVGVTWSARRLIADAVARLDARADQDADPAVLTPDLRRSRRHNPPVGDAAESQGAGESERALEMDLAPGAGRRGDPDPERTETEAQEELARILQAQRRRMRGHRRDLPDSE
jgi:hypothetical protein